MISFDADTHRNIIQVNISNDDISFSVMVGGQEFEEAPDTLLDGYFLNDWLRETLTAKVKDYFDRHPEMTDAELRRFIEILEAML